MGELRKDLYTNRFVLIAGERAHRPTDQAQMHPHLPASEKCPFCEGNESLTPLETAAIRRPDSRPNQPGWRVRVFPNKYPAVMPAGTLGWRYETTHQWMESVGVHEVIVETPRHEARLPDLSKEAMTDAISVYRDRYRKLAEDKRWESLVLFRNAGSKAGGSLAHPHSQLVALPSIPRRLLDMTAYGMEQYAQRKACIFCDLIIRERNLKSRMVYENEAFAVFQPFAPRVPFETLIFPKRHQARFMELADGEMPWLAEALQDCLSRFDRLLNKPAYNFSVHSAPLKARIEPMMHWHLEVFPRLAELGGFEWGSDCHIHPVFPERAAQLLREV